MSSIITDNLFKLILGFFVFVIVSLALFFFFRERIIDFFRNFLV